MLTCLFNPIECVQTTISGWIAAIPFEWLFWGTFGAGLILGAVLGKWGVAALLAGLAALAVFNARTPDRHQIDVTGNDGKPNSDFVMFPKKTRPMVKLRGKRVYDPVTDTWKDS